LVSRSHHLVGRGLSFARHRFLSMDSSVGIGHLTLQTIARMPSANSTKYLEAQDWIKTYTQDQYRSLLNSLLRDREDERF